MEFHGLDVESIQVVSKTYEITGDDKENFEIEVVATIASKITLEVDDENTGIYDREDDVTLFREITVLELQQKDLVVPVKISFNIDDSDDYDKSYDILEFNNSKDVELSPDGWDSDYY